MRDLIFILLIFNWRQTRASLLSTNYKQAVMQRCSVALQDYIIRTIGAGIIRYARKMSLGLEVEGTS